MVWFWLFFVCKRTPLLNLMSLTFFKVNLWSIQTSTIAVAVPSFFPGSCTGALWNKHSSRTEHNFWGKILKEKTAVPEIVTCVFNKCFPLILPQLSTATCCLTPSLLTSSSRPPSSRPSMRPLEKQPPGNQRFLLAPIFWGMVTSTNDPMTLSSFPTWLHQFRPLTKSRAAKSSRESVSKSIEAHFAHKKVSHAVQWLNSTVKSIKLFRFRKKEKRTSTPRCPVPITGHPFFAPKPLLGKHWCGGSGLSIPSLGEGIWTRGIAPTPYKRLTKATNGSICWR